MKFSNSIFSDDLISKKNLSSNKDVKCNNIQQDSYYLGGNSPKKETEKISMIKNELECENDKNIDNFLSKDIINSINEIKSESENNSELYEDENNSLPQNNYFEFDNINIENKIKSENPFNANEDKQNNFYNGYLNNNININNGNKINNWNFNISPNEIFNIDNQKNQQTNNEKPKLNNNNIHTNIDLNTEENNPNLNKTIRKNETFKLNIENVVDKKINNEECLKNGVFFDKNIINQNFNIFQNQYNNINFGNKINNIQNQNDYIKNNFIVNNFFKQKDLNINQLNKINKIAPQEDIKDKLNKKKQGHPNFFNNNNNNNFNLYKNNKFISYNNIINIINHIHQNKNISFDPYITTTNGNNLNNKDYLLKMFGRLGWICRICNNFNFKSRNICNRCKAEKAPKTIEEINKEKEIKIEKNKKIKEEKIKEEKLKKTDWFCPNCANINYGFRKYCNRCNLKRKKEFPSVCLMSNNK